jgi:hypothetical protein
MRRFWVLEAILLAVSGVDAIFGAYGWAAGATLFAAGCAVWRIVRVRQVRRRRLDEIFS